MCLLSRAFAISRDSLTALAELDRLHPDRDQDVEAERICALLDGLTMHLLLDPTHVPATLVRSVLLTHLGDLHAPPTSPPT